MTVSSGGRSIATRDKSTFRQPRPVKCVYRSANIVIKTVESCHIISLSMPTKLNCPISVARNIQPSVDDRDIHFDNDTTIYNTMQHESENTANSIECAIICIFQRSESNHSVRFFLLLSLFDWVLFGLASLLVARYVLFIEFDLHIRFIRFAILSYFLTTFKLKKNYDTRCANVRNTVLYPSRISIQYTYIG